MFKLKEVLNRSLLTPFNLVAGIIILMGLVITALRFTGGWGSDEPFRL